MWIKNFFSGGGGGAGEGGGWGPSSAYKKSSIKVFLVLNLLYRGHPIDYSIGN